MSNQVACDQLMLVVEKMEKEGEKSTLSKDSPVVCMARVGAETEKIVSTSLETGRGVEMGAPLHSLVIPGECHFL